jgi:hypothetical protein
MERQTYDCLVFAYISCNQYQDHCAISAFRSRFATEIAEFSDQMRSIADVFNPLNSDAVFFDGAKTLADASKHHAYGYGQAKRT